MTTSRSEGEGEGGGGSGFFDEEDRQGHVLLLHSRLLGRRLYLYSLGRFGVAAGITVAALFTRYILGQDQLPLAALIAAAAFLFVVNIGIFAIVWPHRNRREGEAGARFLAGVMHGTIALDFILLTVTIWLIGGARSPFQAFYIFHVLLASVLLSRRSAIGHAVLGYALLAAMVLSEWLGWIPARAPIGMQADPPRLTGVYVLVVLLVYGFLFVLSALLLTRLMGLLRAGERDLRLANERLARLSAMRRDFLHVALHNLKSPAAAVAQYMYNLESQLADRVKEPEQEVFERCRIRLDEMNDLLTDLQTLAHVEAEELRKQAGAVDMAALVQNVVEEYQNAAQARGHNLRAETPKKVAQVRGVERLLREAIVNFVTNSIKYTPENGQIVARIVSGTDRVRVEVADNGIGIAENIKPKLFEEFGAVGRDDPRVDRSHSSGLGLSIVRRIAELHGGRVGVESAEEEGSTFYMELPRWKAKE